jgi:hypothetical protein
MYSVILISLRTGLGVALSLGLGYGAILAYLLVLDFFLFSFSDLTLSSWTARSIWFTALGLLSGGGAYLAWIDADKPRQVDVGLLALVCIAGLGGSWAALYYSLRVNEGNPFTDNPVSGAALFAACLAANGMATTLAVIKQARQGRHEDEQDEGIRRYMRRRRW